MKWFWKNDRKTSPELGAIQHLKEQNNILMDKILELSGAERELDRLMKDDHIFSLSFLYSDYCVNRS
ncbi:hypothetical protein [Siminovitchia fortis]|nr:hypothetical protein [Siminovitchia fortis]